MGCLNKAMATTSEAPKVMASYNNLNKNYPDSSALSSLKSLRAYINNPLYCGRLQNPMTALSVKKRSQRVANHA